LAVGLHTIGWENNACRPLKKRRRSRPTRGPDFIRHLEALRVKYKIKRNFIKLVEQKRKSLYLS
jgi:hypothetical protein